MMQDCDLHQGQLCPRRAVLRAALALAPWAVFRARAESDDPTSYPADPNGTVRDGTPLNLVILVRVGSDGLNEETRARSADGVVAYSAICTHQSCPVNQWSTEKMAM